MLQATSQQDTQLRHSASNRSMLLTDLQDSYGDLVAKIKVGGTLVGYRFQRRMIVGVQEQVVTTEVEVKRVH